MGCYAACGNCRRNGHDDPVGAGWSAPVRATLMARALGDYGRLIIWPANLHMERTVFDPDSLQSSTSWRKANRPLNIFRLRGFSWRRACLRRHAEKALLGGSPNFRRRLVSYCLSANLKPFRVERHGSRALALSAQCRSSYLRVGCCVEFPRAASVASGGICLPGLRRLVPAVLSAARTGSTRKHFTNGPSPPAGKSLRVAINLGQVYSSKGNTLRQKRLFRRVVGDKP